MILVFCFYYFLREMLYFCKSKFLKSKIKIKNQMKQFKFTIILISLLLLSNTSENLFAQQRQGGGGQRPQGTGERPTGIISGKLLDNETKKPVVRATVAVNEPTTKKTITGGFTDRNGDFNINVPFGKYSIKITFLGYETHEINDVVIGRNSMNFNAGTISLKLSSIMTDEVRVVAEREAIEVGLDRRIFNIEQDMQNIGGSALDILANIPSVTVDQDDNVSLRGNSNVKVMIDGRVSNLTASEALEQIPSTMVSSVELITNPGARYEADGTAGMINIVTTRQRDDGFNGMVNLNGGFNQVGEPRHAASIAANMNIGKWNFFANFSSRTGTRSGTSERDRILYSGNNILQALFQEGERTGGMGSFRGKIGADYNFTKNDVLTYTFTAGASRRRSNNDNKYWVYGYPDRDYLLDYYTRNEDNQSPFGTNLEHTLSYKHNFKDKGHELYVDLYYNRHDREGLTYYNQYNYPGLSDLDNYIFSKQKNASDIKSDGYTAQVDYARPIGTNFKLESGGKYTIRTGDINNYLADLITDTTGGVDWVLVPNRENIFGYTEQVYAGYITGSTKLFDVIKTNVGVRYEATVMDFEDKKDTSLSFKTEHTNLLPNLFPSVYLGYELNMNHQFFGNFSKRMRRPSYRDLNPTTNYEDPLNLRKGNPELIPEKLNSFELGYLMNYDKSTLSATLFHRYSNNAIEQWRSVILDEEGRKTDTTLSMPKNTRKTSRTGFELIYMHKIFDNWKADANLSLYSYSIDARNIGATTQTAFNWTARINSQLDLMQRFLNITLSANINSKMLRAQGEAKGNWNLDASFRLNFSRQLNVSLRIQDIFNTRQWNSIENIPGILYSENKTNFNSRGFVLGVSYRFNNYRQKRERNLDDGRMSEGDGE